MTNSFLKGLAIETSKSFTENGATAFNSAGSGALLDLFSMCGSLRSRPEVVPEKFIKAMIEDKGLATKLAFYTRDIRGGLGERDTGRTMFKVIAKRYPEIMEKNIEAIPTYGRWDDLFSVMGTPVEEHALRFINNQLTSDMENMRAGNPVSLLAKWMPSINASSHETKVLANYLADKLGMTPRVYRKTLSALRSYLNVTEVRMTAKDYEHIRYSEVPSNAMHNYRNAFMRNDEERFSAFINALKSGETKINASTLYPYNIIEKYVNSYRYCEVDPVLEEQWSALPNYVDGENNFLIMADISGSMCGRPMATSVGLAIYFAERNAGAYHNVFMTFSSEPNLVEITGETLLEKTISVFRAGMGYSTNLEKAFDTILNNAVENNIRQEDMPTSLIVITDGEIDILTRQTRWGFVDEMKTRFENAGYQMPNLVLWNVNSRNDTFHASGFAEGVQMCSGQSASTFQSLTGSVGMTPYEYMLSVLNDPRYDAITI